jgi:uncharacterized protein YodC (DUF2158 family)
MGYACKRAIYNEFIAIQVVNEPPEPTLKALDKAVTFLNDCVSADPSAMRELIIAQRGISLLCGTINEVARHEGDNRTLAYVLVDQAVDVIHFLAMPNVSADATTSVESVSVGSVGRLKSGGPLMTVVGFVERADFPGLIAFSWMFNGEVNTADFPVESVEFVSGPELASAIAMQEMR